MTDDPTTAPAPGWYDDPSGAAPYRRWDGAHWTPETLHELPTAQDPVIAALTAEATSAGVPTADATTAAAAPDGSFPSRRSLRLAAEADAAAPALAAPAPAPAPAPAASAPPVDGFVTPAAWAAHAPAAPLAPAAPAPPPYGSRGGYPAGASPWSPPPVSRDRNTAARWALTLPLLVLVITGVINGAARAGAFGAGGPGFVLLAGLGILMILMILAAVPLAIVGLVHAHRVAESGQRPRGRPHAIVGLVIVVLVGLAAGPSFGAGFARGVHSQSEASTVQPSAAPAAPVAPLQTPAAGTAQTPDSGTAQDQNGAETYVYSQALTQSSIAQAITTKTNITPNSVQCPASEPLVIGTTFDCSVALPSTGTLTVKVTVMSEQGQLSFQALP